MTNNRFRRNSVGSRSNKGAGGRELGAPLGSRQSISSQSTLRLASRIILISGALFFVLLGFENCTHQGASTPSAVPSSTTTLEPTAIESQGTVQSKLAVNVLDFGATGNGVDDDTAAFKAAIASMESGGMLFVPQGKYVISETLTVTKPISIYGVGLGSQIYQAANLSLFVFQGVAATTVSGLYLGSAATEPGASLLKFINSHHNRIVNMSMLGGYYGLYLNGSLINTIEDLRSGTNFQRFFAPTSANQYWVYADAINRYSANANTFIAPVLEGGVNGIYLSDTGGQGSLNITGGTIEGLSGVAVTFYNTFLPSSIIGLHMEENAEADIVIHDSLNIRISAVLALKGIIMSQSTAARAPRNISISDSIVEHITIPESAKRIRIVNLTTCTKAGSVGSGIVNNVPPGSTDKFDGSPSVVMSQIGPYCYGE